MNNLSAKAQILKEYAEYHYNSLEEQLKGLEMDAPDQFQEVGTLFTDGRFVTVLKKMAISFVPLIEADRIARHQAAHDLADRRLLGLKEEMKAFGQQGPGVTPGFCLLDNGPEPVDKTHAILIIAKNETTVIATRHDVLEHSGKIDSCFSDQVLYPADGSYSLREWKCRLR